MGDAGVHNSIADGTYLGPVFQARSIRVEMRGHEPAAGSPPAAEDAWVRTAAGSSVWDHVSHTRDADTVRGHVLAVVGVLARLRDEAQAALEADPWQDPGMPERFAERVEWILGEPDAAPGLDLYPAEAGLLVLLPFLYRVNWLRMTARYSVLDPARLERLPGADGDRLSFEAFAEEHAMLVKRARLRPEAAAPIGWWLFHRWALHRGSHADPHAVQELLDALGETARPLGEILGASRVTRLLHGIRRGADVGNAEFLEGMPSDDRVRAPGQGHQRVRDRRLVLMAALAYGTCADMVALPDVVVEHLGIPHPVDLGRLRATLEEATWGGQATLPVLRADCHHEAVIEGLRDYTARADEILHGVHRAARDRITHPMPVLPTRLSADDVRPADGVFDGWAGFRLDERRVRELLMGVQLYKDRDLAVRELYQNALDACRYRRARSDYLDRTEAMSYAYEGRITFEQGIDDDGRAYLECRDNGIGMGDAELRGVFSQAGARFAEQTDFKLERAAWAQLEPPVVLFPNSRFGIGVLSYFMLADELTVTTCRMGLTGTPGPVLEVSVHGPGHLFRIARIADRGEHPGTRVRLYLRDGLGLGEHWSCIDVLERTLGVAEFDTTADHDERNAAWTPGRLRVRKQPDRERFGLDAHGERVDCPDTPPGVTVTWTEHGGALLVDGLVVQPAAREGVLSSADSGLTGVVVNLSGAHAPAQLSADRAQILDDVSPFLRDLLTRAAATLAAGDSTLLDFSWVCRIAHQSPQLADLLTAAAMEAGRPLAFGSKSIDPVRTGVLPSDAGMFLGRRPFVDDEVMPWDFAGAPPDHIYLWRLLAHAPHPVLDQLAEFCPDLTRPAPVLAAMPSDQLLLSSKGSRSDYWHWNERSSFKRNDYAEAAGEWGVTPFTAARRAVRLGMHELRPGGLPSVPVPVASGPDFDALRDLDGVLLWRGVVPSVTALVKKSSEAGKSPAEVSSVWRDFGMDVPDAVIVLAQAALADELLLLDGRRDDMGWFDPGETVPPGRIVQAAIERGISVGEVCARYRAFGLVADSEGLPDRPAAETEIVLREFCSEGMLWLTRPCVLPPAQILLAAESLKVLPSEAQRIYHGLGFPDSAPLPSTAEIGDLNIVDDGEDIPDYLPPGPFPYRLIFDAVGPGRSLGDVVVRLREYGFVVPLRVPGVQDSLDSHLLNSDGPCSWWDVGTGEPMPFAHLLVAARSTFHSLHELTERMKSYGIPLSCDGLPHGLSHETALMLLKTDAYGDDAYLWKGSKVSLQTLLGKVGQLKVPLRQIVDWLTHLGIPVPDVGEVLREALAAVPRPAP